MKEILERISEPTPIFWKKIGRLGVVLASIGGAIAFAPIGLPAAIVTIGSYVGVAGGVLKAMSPLASTMR
jgi:hypothetical protein